MDNATALHRAGYNHSNWTHGLQIISEPYELIWTPEVVFRVTTIVIVMILTIIGNVCLPLLHSCKL